MENHINYTAILQDEVSLMDGKVTLLTIKQPGNFFVLWRNRTDAMVYPTP